MSNARLIRLAMSVAAAHEEPMAGLWERITGQPPVMFRREGADTVEFSGYFPGAAPDPAAVRKAFAQGLLALRQTGLDVASSRLVFKAIPKEDWAESWKKHFPAVEIGAALLLKPSWSRRKPRPGQLELILDPGLSFGTGHHATTAFCLRQLVKFRPRREPRSLLDIGMGSGILAIAGAKLGYAPVEAFDFDPESLRVARENAAVNGVAESVRLSRQDLGRLPLTSRRRYDLVCANLEFDLLLREARRILNRLKPGGALVLAGILDRQFAAVCSAYEKSGLVMVASRGQGEWRSGAFRAG